MCWRDLQGRWLFTWVQLEGDRVCHELDKQRHGSVGLLGRAEDCRAGQSAMGSQISSATSMTRSGPA